MTKEREATEVRRMLLWFKSTLPPHDLDAWHVTAHPEPPPILIDGDEPWIIGRTSDEQLRIRGYATCARCGQRFDIPSIGNAVAFDESRVGAVVEEMKAWVRRDAERDGPCWGDVPQLDDREIVAVLDGSTARKS